MSKVLDAQVAAFRNRPLEGGPYAFVWVDALTQKVREGGRIVNVHVLVATGVNADGHREILGVKVTSAEDGAGWLAFLRGLVARGLTGVQLVISDAHRGLIEAIAATLPGAGWQRCRTHYLRNLLTRVPKSAQPWVATLVRSLFDPPAAEEVHVQHARVVASLEAKRPEAAEHLDAARDDLLAFTAFPRQLWRQIWSNTPQERLNKTSDSGCSSSGCGELGGECFGWVICLAGLEAVIELADHPVEQVSQGRGVFVAGGAPPLVVLACRRMVDEGHERPAEAGGGEPVILTRGCVIEMLFPDARVTGADPA
ncbi:hypothetical protein GCM10009546_01970 [Actinomadura livida]|uniref:Mutator family transposase n=1 Tax=Actinomadura livida TaxID=79909 RepID=A0A7W7MVH8_9ACTN|nr:hypothetical protein [Actinomadura catellatispora]GGU02565.1 hypothetical protein GCM10010208_28210 [Actinomadura livida]